MPRLTSRHTVTFGHGTWLSSRTLRLECAWEPFWFSSTSHLISSTLCDARTLFFNPGPGFPGALQTPFLVHCIVQTFTALTNLPEKCLEERERLGLTASVGLLASQLWAYDKIIMVLGTCDGGGYFKQSGSREKANRKRSRSRPRPRCSKTYILRNPLLPMRPSHP